METQEEHRRNGEEKKNRNDLETILSTKQKHLIKKEKLSKYVNVYLP